MDEKASRKKGANHSEKAEPKRKEKTLRQGPETEEKGGE